ncbi:hypothetical protein [Clostridium perfringens]|uniref:hypothetical protein n=1 Tax=Clostridium perfringens TaxID=1502 RepID=UPI0024BC8F54|nr:hypothetical protein [Clostridium perfringens]
MLTSLSYPSFTLVGIYPSDETTIFVSLLKLVKLVILILNFPCASAFPEKFFPSKLIFTLSLGLTFPCMVVLFVPSPSIFTGLMLTNLLLTSTSPLSVISKY